MSDIVWAVNPKRDNALDLSHRMRRFASDTLSARNIEFHLSTPNLDRHTRVNAEIRREVFLMMPYFDGLHRFLPALVRREGYDIAYVDVIDRPRHSGVSNYGFFDRLWIGIMDLFGVWWLIRRKRPTPVATEVQ